MRSKNHHCCRRSLFVAAFWLLFCQNVVFCSIWHRFQRDAINGHNVGGVNIEWLTDQQLSELSQAPDQPARMDKLRQFFDAMEAGPAKEQATQKIVAKCYDWVKEIASEAEQQEMERIHHQDHEQCKQKVRALLARLEEGSEKREQVESRLPFCEHVWYSTHTATRVGGGHHHGEEEEQNAQHEQHGGHHHHHHHGDDQQHHHAGKRWAHRHPREGTTEQQHTLEDYLQTHLNWLTDEQKEQMRAAKEQGKAALQAKAMEFFEQSTGEQRERAIAQLQNGCRELLKKTFGEEKATELKQLKEAGTSVDEMEAKINAMTNALEDEGKKARVREYGPACKKIFTLSAGSESRRMRREGEEQGQQQQQPSSVQHEGHAGDHGQHTIEDYFRTHLSWLTDAQKEELKQMKADGKSRAEMQQKVLEWFDGTEGEAKQQAIQLLQGGCKEMGRMVFGEEKVNKLKEMKESGTNGEKIKAQVEEWIGALQDEHKKQIAETYKPMCAKVYEASKATAASRRRRDHHEGHTGDHGQHTIEDYFRTHLSWLTDVQKEELRQLKADGKSRAELQQKVLEWFDATEGETKQKATELLQGGCKEMTQMVLGEEKANKLKEMRESGTSAEKIKEQALQWVSEIQDEHKKQIAELYKPMCAKAFGVAKAASRQRRDHHGHEGHEGDHGQHTIEDYFRTHLSWLTDTQKEELRQLKADGKSRAELQQKVLEWFDATEGETKKNAAQLLQGGCKEMARMVFGEEKANKLKEMKESGADGEKIKAQAEQWVSEIQDEHKKQIAELYKPMCAKAFGVAKAASRRRRDHHEGHTGDHGQHTIEDYFRTHLSWLTDIQKEELKQLKTEGKTRAELQQKVLEWFDATEGETKQKAKELLQGGCKEMIRMVLGEEKANKLKEMRESGTSAEKIAEQAEQWLSEVHDEHKKQIGATYKPTCVKVFQPARAASRRRRAEEEAEHNIEETMEDHFDTHLRWLSGEQTEQLKQMMNSRAEMHQKVVEWFAELEGESRQKATEIVKKGCRDLSKVILGEARVAEVARMKQAGVSPMAVSAKIDAWIDGMEEGWKKTVALEHKAICHEVYKPSRDRSRRSNRHRHRYQEDEEDMDEEQEESAADSEQQQRNNRRNGNRRQEEEEETGDEVQLDEGGGEQQRRQRGRHQQQEEEGNRNNYALGGNHNLDRHYSWLNAHQKKTLKQMRDRGHHDHELHDKIHQFYQVSPDEVKATAKGILQKGCEAILQRLFGNYKAEEIIQMREDGASNAEVDEKIDEALALIRNPEKREEAARFALTCRRIFAMIERRRRAVAPTEKTLNELFKSHLSWLSEDQKAELKQYQEEGASRTELQQKVMAWYTQLEGPAKAGALEHLRDGCRELLTSVIGHENVEMLKQLKESGADEEQIEAKGKQLIEAVQDERKQATAREFGPTCQKIFKGI